MKKVFPTLYKLTGAGEIQEWTIIVDGNKMISKHGRHGGKIIESAPDIITEGKNIGKKNETTPAQQALLEAQSDWEKKLKKGYVQSIEAAKGGEVSTLVEGGIWPMLAQRYDKYGEKIVWSAFAQPKFDGHRCIAIVDGAGKCKLWSRTRKPIISVPHIVKAIEQLGLKNITLDGELYNHAYREKFEELSHFINQKKEPADGYQVVQYHIYDSPNGDSFAKRNAFLSGAVADAIERNVSVRPQPLVIAETIPVADEDELMAAFEHYREEGYEGCMVRNADGLYMGHPTHRSYDLQKVKEFEDAEFEVIGVNEGRGKMAGHAIFICKTDEGAEFTAKMIGKLADLKKFVDNPKLAIGKMLTVQFQGYNKSKQDGQVVKVPRFPVALRFRVDI